MQLGNEMKKALFIYNSKSGNAEMILNNFDLIISRFLKHGVLINFYSISKKYDRLAYILEKEKYDMLILSGGDGTLSETLSELYRKNIEIPPVGIFPTGTSNDLAKSLKLGENIEEWIYNIIKYDPKPIDFGVINNQKVFLSSYAAGLFTKVSYSTDKGLKKVMGKTAYHIAGIAELTNIKKFKLEMLLDTGERISEEAILYIILNGRSVGGFESVIKEANVSDGLMNIMIVKNIENPLDIPGMVLDLFNNSLSDNVHVKILTARSCTIEAIDEEIGVSIDGEEGTNERVEIRFIQNQLKIFRK